MGRVQESLWLPPDMAAVDPFHYKGQLWTQQAIQTLSTTNNAKLSMERNALYAKALMICVS